MFLAETIKKGMESNNQNYIYGNYGTTNIPKINSLKFSDFCNQFGLFFSVRNSHLRALWVLLNDSGIRLTSS